MWVLSLTSWDLRRLWAHFSCLITGYHLLSHLNGKAAGEPSAARLQCGQEWTVPCSHVPPVTTCVQSQPRSPVSHEQHKTSCKDGRQQPSFPPLSSPLPPRHFWKKGAEVREQGVPSRRVSWLWRPEEGDSRRRSPSHKMRRATSPLSLWCCWPRLGLPSGAKKGQHRSAWVLPQPQMTWVWQPHRAGIGSHLGL